jgi:broad specificity phosphatase PhoE
VECKKNKIIIIVLVILLAVSIGFNIYYGRSASVAYANQLRETIARLESRISDLSDLNAEQGIALAHILDELRASSELASDLRRNNERAVELARRSNERLVALERGMESAGTTIEGLIIRQRLIDQFVREQSEDNRRLREALGIGD